MTDTSKPADGKPGVNRRAMLLGSSVAAATAMGAALTKARAQADATAASTGKRPNILVIMGDDIGMWNVSAYSQGMMGYRTPNIDRIAHEGVLFTDAYAQNSCTAGRAAFLTGQCPFRTGLLKIGMPGSKEGLSKKDPTIAEMLKPLGYATGQFGKNHLGDSDDFLPTNHGFDEFFGNLYHLNAEEEPENEDYNRILNTPDLRKRFGPRGVIHSYANADGSQKIEDTGPLTKKRMETVDEEFLDASLKFIDRAHGDGKPFFVWFNSTRMHINTHLRKESQGVTGRGLVADAMVEHDGMVGRLLAKLDTLGVAQDTLVVYTTDNGAEVMSWPDGGTIPFRGEKNTTWEGGFRVPMMVRYPARIKPGQVCNDIISLEDWAPTILAAAGEPQIKEKLAEGYALGNVTYKVHLDGYNLLPSLSGAKAPWPRNEFFYFTDGGSLSAFRYGDWKLIFSVQNAEGMDVWIEPFTALRAPLIFNLRMDPFERAKTDGIGYDRWFIDHMYVMVPAQAFVGRYIATYKAFPPRQKPGSFTLDDALSALATAKSGD